MQTPPKDAPQSARKSAKHHRPRPDVQKSVQSDNDAYMVVPQEGDQTPSRKSRKPRKKSNARKSGVQSDVGETAEYHGPRHFNQNEHVKHTPAKAIRSDAYAGPTFHQSPAASALPMPSFISRSVPNNAAISPIAETVDGSSDSRQEKAAELEEKREPTPLDWMFDAARQARGTPNAASPARMLSPAAPSPAASTGAREADFPFELDGVDESKSVYSTPFSQRLAASRSPPSTSEGGPSLTEEERRAKTAALKQALLNSPGSDQPGSNFNDNNPFNAKNAPMNPNFSPRHSSNPSTPSYTNGYAGSQNNHYFHYGMSSPGRNFAVQPGYRPPSSNLRNVYDPAPVAPMSPPNTAPDHRISTARSPQPARAINFEAIYGPTSRPQSEGNPIGHKSKPSLEQGLDDLKKALNMNFLGQA